MDVAMEIAIDRLHGLCVYEAIKASVIKCCIMLIDHAYVFAFLCDKNY